jgi:electron transport complex protein RnfC
MGMLTFKGGVHPYDGKDISKDKPVVTLLPQGELVYPLSQHIGAPAKAVVAKGDHVLAGQVIGEASGFVSANVHASVSGTVKAVEPRILANGMTSDCIIVENDGLYEEVPFEAADYKKLTKDEILARIKAAGVVGMGGAGFPTHVKLSPKEPDKIDYIILNGAECEPYLTSDYRRMLDEGELVVEGLEIMLSMFPKAKGYIGIEANKPDAIAHMKELCTDHERIEVKVVKTKYPQGGERPLIYATTGRSMNSSMLPADVGCIVQNVDTAACVYKAVALGKPVFMRYFTVTGEAVANPSNFEVRTGMNYREALEAAGGVTCEAVKYISGGPMMGFAMTSLDVPVTKGTSSLLVLKEDIVALSESSPCIRCARCVDVCPGRVMPSKLAVLAERGNKEAFVKNGGMECCECGCCSFICPAKRPLTQTIKSMRKQVLAERKK